ncbi:MAG: molybdopterin oxidoreductase, partial [bacterium]|nr:molybdopterin oxidoreductase [bacterium]
MNPDSGDNALAMAMIRWIIENERYDRRYLTNANKAAAKADKEPTWTNATYMVTIEEGGKPGALLRASEVGLGNEHQFVVSKEGALVAVTPTDDATPVEGDLFVETESGGLKLKSAFQLLKESAFSKGMDEYATISGIERPLIEAVANEFTSHGKKVAIDFYRGAVQHTNGYYTGQAIIALNLLVGCPDWKGGLSKGGGHWHEFGG